MDVKMKIAGITYDSLVDGPGLRVVIFAQGCLHGCPHCHNPESWDINAGQEYTTSQILRMIKKPRAGKVKVRGLTFSGGEPFLQSSNFTKIAQEAKALGWDITTYTGYTYEELVASNNTGFLDLLNATDYLIDGLYIHSLRDLDARFRGSTNQRIIDVKATQAQGDIVLWDDF